MKAHVLLGSFGLALLAGCTIVPESYVCEAHTQCVSEFGDAGTCERDGVCSFPDETCDNGRRYAAEFAGERSGQCVEPWIAQLSYSFTQHFPSLVVGAGDELYLSDTFTDKVTLGQSELLSEGPTDIYVAEIDRTVGSLTSFERLGGDGSDWLGGAARYSDGIVTTGVYDDGMSIDGVDLEAGGAFIARRYDREWVAQCSADEGWVAVNNLEVDPLGFVVATGYFAGGNLTIDGEVRLLANAGYYKSFLAIFDGIGEFQGALELQDEPTAGCASVTADGQQRYAALCFDEDGRGEVVTGSYATLEERIVAMSSSPYFYISAIELHPDNDGSLLVAGVFVGIAGLPPVWGSDEPVAIEAEGQDLYVAHIYFANDEWHTETVTTVAAPDAGIYPLSMVASGTEIYVAGTVEGEVPALGPSAGANDAFVVRLSAEDLSIQDARVMGGSGNDELTSIAVDGQGRLYGFGHFTGTMTFGSQTLESAGPYDGFVAEL